MEQTAPTNRMSSTFQTMAEQGKKILVGYFPLCDPVLGDQVAQAQRHFSCGVSVLEMGLPYENPVLDGKTVRDSMARALERGGVDAAFATIAQLRQACPNNILQVMTYSEIAERIGLEAFAQRCAEVGVDAVLSPNMSSERLVVFDEALAAHNIINLRFAPYHLSTDVIEELKTRGAGYIFQQAVDGPTGAQAQVSPQIATNVKRLKVAGITTPICAGFGISNGAQAHEACAMGADGVIVGSAILSHILAGDGEAFITSLREGLDAA